MYRELLNSQWRGMGFLTLFLSLMVFAVPVGLVLGTGIGAATGSPEEAVGILGMQTTAATIYPIMALLTGGLLALAAWNDDLMGKHVYALALPVPRWYYLLLRMSVGLTFVAIPAVALVIGGLIATSQVQLPPGLHAYPAGLAVRFLLASTLVFCGVFAVTSASERTLKRLGAVFGILLLVVILAGSLGISNLVERAFRVLAEWPSFMDAFAGRWLLIDV